MGDEPITTTDDKEPAASEKDEQAYEDSWYRSLKALAEARRSQGHDEEDDEGGTPEG